MKITDNEKTEANTRLQFDALRGPGAAQKVYASELTRKTQHWENLRIDFSAHDRPLPQNASADLSRLKSQGLTTLEKITALHRALGDGPSASAAIPAPVASRAVTQPAPVINPFATLAEYERLASEGKSREAGAYYLQNADAICAETHMRDQQRGQEFRRQSEAQRRKGY